MAVGVPFFVQSKPYRNWNCISRLAFGNVRVALLATSITK
jgi:hypothetical protein